MRSSLRRIAIQRLLIHIGEPITPHRTIPARAPPDWLEADFDNDSVVVDVVTPNDLPAKFREQVLREAVSI